VNVPPDWPLVLIVVVAVAVALDAGPNLAAAVPAGVVAVVAAGLLFLAAGDRAAWRRPPPSPMAPPMAASSLRLAFQSGRTGRLSVVAQLDRIERMGPHPLMEVRSVAEEERIVRLSKPDFRAYVRQRLRTIEAAER
jgi:hypothetical protein